MATKGLGDRDVTDAAILRVDLDERLYVPIFFELPQGLDKLIRNLFRYGITPLNIRICLYTYMSIYLPVCRPGKFIPALRL